VLRRIGYRQAVTMFAFTGMWFIFGLIVVWSPIPGALGIGDEMLFAWGLLFLVVLAIAGASLTLAAINGLFPPAPRPVARRAAHGAVRTREVPLSVEDESTAWTSPLPQRPVSRPTGTSTTPVRPARPNARRGG
jgi:hypothetical protein